MNRELDKLVAEKVMGGFVDNPDDWSDKCETWFWVHPRDGILIGEPWEITEGQYDHSWRKFSPSESIEDAWEVVKIVEGREDFWKTSWEHCPASSKFQDGREYSWVCFNMCWNDKGTQFKTGKFFGNVSLPVAICKAALLAVE